MKTIKFKTIAQKTYKIQFNEDAFFDYMKRCGVANLPFENQVYLYLNNLHESLLRDGVLFDAVLPQTIDYKSSKTFRKKYSYLNEILKYGL